MKIYDPPPFGAGINLVANSTGTTGGTTNGLAWSDGTKLQFGPATTDASGNIVLPATKAISWASSSILTDTSNGVLKMTTSAGNIGLILDFSSDQKLQLRDRTNAAFADLNLRNAFASATVGVAVTTATPAGGSTGVRLTFGTTTGFGIYAGSGAPSVTAGQGSLYLRSDGSSAITRAYINTDGGTTWTAVSTVL